jgi:endonuclease/exonuclease/phosphatase family metal-dependent hydrolase
VLDLLAHLALRSLAMVRSLAVLAVLAGCTHRGGFDDPNADADPVHPYPPPRTDVVPAVGGPDTLEIATWNIRNFPGSATTPSVVADLITSLDLDVIVVQEIASEVAWEELLQRLRDHDGVLSTHRYTPLDYQKLGVIYRRSLVEVGEPSLLFVTDTSAFPRPPLSLAITVDGLTLELVGVHLKAGVTDEDAARRRAAIRALDTRLRAQVDGGGEDEVVLLGDYNERLTDDRGLEVLGPLLDAPDRYTLRTEAAALAGGATYLGFGGHFIDHITTTAALDARWGAARIEVPPLNVTVPGFRQTISDHLPVVLIVPR